MTKTFYVVGMTHVDLAWKRGRDEMSEMMEVVVIRLLDAMQQHPDFKYHLEQAAHFRELAKRRPDLIERLRPFVQAGRLEFVGGMASTLENNLPNGECFVRNQQLGLKWVLSTFGVEVKTGWLVDTFGVNAQVPQLLRGFGIAQLVANRFGGDHTHDLCKARGLDGSEITVAGWGTYAAYMRPESLSVRFCKSWEDIEECFRSADTLTGPGPYMVTVMGENEMLVSMHPLVLTRQRQRDRSDQIWITATPGDFLAAVQASGRSSTLPVIACDLNPEFTGCFSLRHPIRLRNRQVENRLLEAEKWAALAHLRDSAITAALEDAWWELAFVQFHDVFTGSQPTGVFRDVMARLDAVDASAGVVLHEAFTRLAPPTEAWPASRGSSRPNHSETPTAPTSTGSCPRVGISVVAFNGLPWQRRDVLEFPLPERWEGVARVAGPDGASLPFTVHDRIVRTRIDAPRVGCQHLSLEPGPATPARWQQTDSATLENAWIRLDLDCVTGIARLTWKPTDMVLMENARNWLVAQHDTGSFQIENPCGAELPACCGTMYLEHLEASALGQTARLSGKFPPLSWAGPGNLLHWQATFFLAADRPEIRLSLHLDWKGEASRIRLALPTCLDTATGIYEIPFGVVRRKPHSPRANAKGEWPAHRFVALESAGHGVALVNTGTGGVEPAAGTLLTTLLRAPRSEYAGMVADDTSSQHGHHEYRFSIVPYVGSWADAGVVRYAQELNNPILTELRPAPPAPASWSSRIHVEPANVVLSSIKSAQDNSGDLVIRVYETAGLATAGRIGLPAATHLWECDLREHPDREIAPLAGTDLACALEPFQIRTFRIRVKENPNQ